MYRFSIQRIFAPCPPASIKQLGRSEACRLGITGTQPDSGRPTTSERQKNWVYGRERFQQWQKLPKPGTFVQTVANTERKTMQSDSIGPNLQRVVLSSPLRTPKPQSSNNKSTFIYIYICPGNPEKVWGLGPSIFLSSSLSSYFSLLTPSQFFFLPLFPTLSCFFSSFLLSPSFSSPYSPHSSTIYSSLPLQSPICYFSPAQSLSPPSSDSVSRLQVEKAEKIVRPRSTCCILLVTSFQVSAGGLIVVFLEGESAGVRSENGWLGP